MRAEVFPVNIYYSLMEGIYQYPGGTRGTGQWSHVPLKPGCPGGPRSPGTPSLPSVPGRPGSER